MKKKLFSTIFVVVAFMAFSASAQMMPRGGFVAAQQNSETAQEEAKGKVIFEQLQSGATNCGNLSEEDYELLGEYFMGQWAGSSHEAMNQMMVRMMGEEGERQMHVTLGARQSGCDSNAQFPAGGTGFMPISGMMQNFGGGWPSFIMSLAFIVILWLLIIGGIVMLVRWLILSGRGGATREKESSAIQTLRERYAKGEISKEEFEKMKQDLR